MTRKRFSDERGQAVAFFVGVIFVIFGFMALAIDVGFFFHARRIAQNSADAAALAGASELQGCGDGIPEPLVLANDYAAKNLVAKAFTTGDTLGPMQIGSYDIEGTPYETVYARVTRTQSYLFGGFLGLTNPAIPGEAEAVCAPAKGGGVCPFAVEIDPDDTWGGPGSGDSSAYGIEFGRVYVIKTDAQEGEQGNFLILKLIEGSARETYRDFVGSGCEDPDAESAVIVEEDDVLTESQPGNKSGPTIQALEELYGPEHDFPQGHNTCNLPFRIDADGQDNQLGTEDDGLSGFLTDGPGGPDTSDAQGVVHTLAQSTLCDAMDGPTVVEALLHPAVQGRFMQIVLIEDRPNGSSDPIKVFGILRMYIVCWDGQDGVSGGCGTGVPPGQHAIYGVFDEYFEPNLLQVVGVSNNPFASKHVVLVR